jgi:hypothetical protein
MEVSGQRHAPADLTPRIRLSTQSVGSWLDRKECLDNLEKILVTLSGLEFRIFHATSWLRYHGFQKEEMSSLNSGKSFPGLFMFILLLSGLIN